MQVPPTKRVLLLGDSIRVGYQPLVADKLRGQAEVVGPADNGRFSLYTLMRLEAWLSELGTPDVVHWNNGLWDCGYNAGRGPTRFIVEDYLRNLRSILHVLRKTGAAVVFATTTPVHPHRPFREGGWYWRNEEIDHYNRAARSVMAAEGVPVNDLHALVHRDLDACLCDDMLHLSDHGKARCAAAVAEAVTPHLADAT